MYQQDIKLIQNPALGSILLWRFCSSYIHHERGIFGCHSILLFTVLPLLLYKDTFDLISATQKDSSLVKFTSKFYSANQVKNDVLLNINDRCINMRSLTLSSLKIAIHSNLLILNCSDAHVEPTSVTPLETGYSRPIKKIISNAEKIGNWYSGLTIYEIVTYLKVNL